MSRSQQLAQRSGQAATQKELAAKEIAQGVTKLCQDLASDNMKARLEQSLPSHIKVEQFVRDSINAIQLHPQKEKLVNCDKLTLFNSLQKAASDGLICNGDEAYLSAFFNKGKGTNDVAYIPMVKGMVKLAQQSRQIEWVRAWVVYEDEHFEYFPGKDDVPDYQPNWKRPPSQAGNPILVYAIVRLKSGSSLVSVLHAERVMQIAQGGNNAYQYDHKNGKHWKAWWEKTAIRNVLKFAPKSKAVEQAIRHADTAEFPSFVNDSFLGAEPEPKPIQHLTDLPPIEDMAEEVPAPQESENPAPAQEAVPPKTETGEISDAFVALSTSIKTAKTHAHLDEIINSGIWGDLVQGEAQSLQKQISVKRDGIPHSQ